MPISGIWSGEFFPADPSTAVSSPQRTPVQAANTFMMKSMSRPDSSAHRSAMHRAWNGVMTFAVDSCVGAGRRPPFRAHPAAAALASLGGVALDLPGVDSVAEDRDQQGTCARWRPTGRTGGLGR